MNFTSDAAGQTESADTAPTSRSGRSLKKRKRSSILLICLLVFGGGFAAYRFMGSGDGPAPQSVTASPSIPAPRIVPPKKPKTKPWVNPAFENLTPQAGARMRSEIAETAVTALFDAGNEVGELAFSLSDELSAIKPKPVVKKKPKPAAPKVKAPPAKPKPPAVLSGSAAGAFQLTGIMSRGSGSLAVINGNVYRVGQTVSGATIDSIHPRHVILRIGERRFKLGM